MTVGDFGVGTDGEAMDRLQLAITRRLAPTVLCIRILGSAAIDLAWLASGKTDVNVTLSNRPWDVGAGVVIAQEAGAVVMNLDGSPYSLKSTATPTAIPALLDPLTQLIQWAIADTEIG